MERIRSIEISDDCSDRFYVRRPAGGVCRARPGDVLRVRQGALDINADINEDAAILLLNSGRALERDTDGAYETFRTEEAEIA